MFSVPASGEAAQLTYTYTSYICVVYIYMHVIYLYIYVIYIHMFILHTCFERGSSIDLYMYVICMCNIYLHPCNISIRIRDIYIYICIFCIPALGEAAHSTYAYAEHIHVHVYICIFKVMYIHITYTYKCISNTYVLYLCYIWYMYNTSKIHVHTCIIYIFWKCTCCGRGSLLDFRNSATSPPSDATKCSCLLSTSINNGFSFPPPLTSPLPWPPTLSLSCTMP